MLHQQVITAWNSLKTKIKKDNLFGPEYQFRLGQILQSLDYVSVRPTVDWQELESAAKGFRQKIVQECRRSPSFHHYYCQQCPHCQQLEEKGPTIEEVE